MNCTGRHWFAYRGWVGSSSPTCTRYGCDAPNPNYRPDDDPKRGDRLRAERRAAMTDADREAERLDRLRRINIGADGRCYCQPPYTDTRSPHEPGGRRGCLTAELAEETA